MIIINENNWKGNNTLRESDYQELYNAIDLKSENGLVLNDMILVEIQIECKYVHSLDINKM